jgi:glycosyltransferase involved in cell wall biosynthesis
MSKVIILLSYYNRPILVQRALESVLNSNVHHQDWHLVVGDDNSPHPAEPIVRSILSNHLDKITFVNTKATMEDKLRSGLSIGKVGNEVILSSSADIAITLCDDDVLVSTYIKDLVDYFDKHPEAMYAWSNIHIYNPFYEVPEYVNNVSGKYNDWHGPIDPTNKLDTSQVAFRTEAFRRHEDIRYPVTTLEGSDPAIRNLDASLFQKLHEHFGPAPHTGLVAQYKGIHDHQLVWHKGDIAGYIHTVDRLAGKKF